MLILRGEGAGLPVLRWAGWVNFNERKMVNGPKICSFFDDFLMFLHGFGVLFVGFWLPKWQDLTKCASAYA